MKVWLVTNSLPPRFSGAGKNDALIGPLLCNYGVEVTFFVRRHKGEKKTTELNGIPVLRAGMAGSLLAHLRWIIDALVFLYNSSCRPDVIRFRGYNFSFASVISIVRLLFPAIKIIIQPACLGQDDPNTVGNKRLGRFQRKQMFRADAVFAMNPVISRLFVENGFPSERIFPVRNVVDTRKFRPLLESEKLKMRRTLGLRPGILIVTLGILDARKGQALITEAYAKYYTREVHENQVYLMHIGPTVKDLKSLDRLDRMSGTSDEESRIARIIKDYNLEHNVILAGNKEDPSNYLSVADIFIHASIGEGEANVVNEALASGLAVLLPDSKVYSAQVPMNSAIRYSVENIDDLSNKIELLVNDKSLRGKLKCAAVNHILETRTAENVARHYAGLLRSSLDN